MLHRKRVAMVAVCTALASGGIVGAETGSSVPDQGLVLRPNYLDDAVPATEPATQPAADNNKSPTTDTSTPPKPLMLLLGKTPVGTFLSNTNISIGGYGDGGYTYDTHRTPGNVINGRVFDTRNEHVVLDQVDFFIDRPVDYAKAAQNHTIDIGGHLDLLYGWDAGLIHSNGLFDNPATLGVTKGYYGGRADPENQFDITQAYVDVALPVGSGLRIRAGKFVTLLGYEVINPTVNPLYSHSYLFGFAIPFTHTGIMGEYKFSDDLQLDAGITRGWNQTFKDNNGDPDFLGGITFTPQESEALKKWKFILNLSEGPQGTHDNSDWWTVLDLQAVYTAPNVFHDGDQLTLAGNLDYGNAPHAIPGVVSGLAQWYGIAAYASYMINPYVTLNSRAEYYGDTKGFTLGVAGVQNLYEATVGAAISPLPNDPVGSNLVIRPEIRYDYSDKNFFSAGARHDQWTLGIDAYFVF
jgi:hypothetical protein